MTCETHSMQELTAGDPCTLNRHPHPTCNRNQAKRMLLVAVATCTLFAVAGNAAVAKPQQADHTPVFIDGEFDEWTADDIVAEDPNGDADAGFDVSFLSARTSGTELFLHFDIGSELNLQSGNRDDGTLILAIHKPSGELFEIDFRKRWASFHETPDEMVPWADLKMVSLPTYATDRIEMRIDLAAIGMSVGETATLQFRGSDELDEAVSVVLQPADATRVATGTIDAPADDVVRVVSMNTWNQGLSDERRAPMIQRLLGSTEGLVFCFQEERDEEMFRDKVTEAIPSSSDATLTTHWFNGCAVASFLPLEPLAMTLDRGAAAAVSTGDGEALIVISVHLKCCGFAGSLEDRNRMDQSRQLAGEIRRLRQGDFGEALKDSPVIVLGDFNLVGSRTPLVPLEELGLEGIMLKVIGGDTAATWRGLGQESFWPGRLDWCVVDADRMEMATGHLLDTEQLDASSLDALGLHVEDSHASDHLMMMIDLKLDR